MLATKRSRRMYWKSVGEDISRTKRLSGKWNKPFPTSREIRLARNAQKKGK